MHSENAPEVDLIMSELNESEFRNELAKLVFDLEKITPSLKFAQDCVMRLEQNWIDIQIQSLREELKNAESSGKDSTLFIKKIEELQSQKNNLSHHHAVDE